MCATCGCSGQHAHGPEHVHADAHAHEHTHGADVGHGARSRRTVRFERALLEKNARLAASNRRDLADRGVVLFNLIGAPGAGKTALLEATTRRLLAAAVPLAVIEGDQATDLDARRIAAAGSRAFQVNTGRGCHLDASMVASGLHAVAPARGSLVFVENVGNLVCPALFDLGEHARVVVMSITEGEDKPLKYPHVFQAADLFVQTKMDLDPLVGFDEQRCSKYARAVNPQLQILRVSAKRGDGMDELCRWFRDASLRLRMERM